jgi:hypothetical protein
MDSLAISVLEYVFQLPIAKNLEVEEPLAFPSLLHLK